MMKNIVTGRRRCMRVDIQADKQRPGFFNVAAHGPIDSETYLEFRDKISPVLENAKGIVVDLKKVDYISSAGLSVFFTMKKKLMAAGGDLLFCNLQPQIKRLFEVVKALPKETLFESMEEADRYFYKIMNDEIQRRKEGQA